MKRTDFLLQIFKQCPLSSVQTPPKTLQLLFWKQHSPVAGSFMVGGLAWSRKSFSGAWWSLINTAFSDRTLHFLLGMKQTLFSSDLGEKSVIQRESSCCWIFGIFHWMKISGKSSYSSFAHQRMNVRLRRNYRDVTCYKPLNPPHMCTNISVTNAITLLFCHIKIVILLGS